MKAESSEECPTHRLPIVVDDKIRNQKFCRMCLLDFVEGDDLKSKHRTTLLHSVESMLGQVDALNNTVGQEQAVVGEKFAEITRHLDETFETIIAGIRAEREVYRKQLFQRKVTIQDTLGKSVEKINDLGANLTYLRDLIKKPLSGTPVDLVSVEHQATAMKKALLAEEKKVVSLQSAILDSDLITAYSESKLSHFLATCVKLSLPDRTLDKSLDMSSQLFQADLLGPVDSVSENFEPVLFKFVWNTRQADCYQVLKGVFCTLTIPNVISKDPEVTNASFVIPKFSKSVITEYNRIYLTGGAKLDTMAPLKYTFEFELETLKLIKKSNMKSGRYHHATAYTSGFIYVSGGNGQSATLNSFERYDTSHDYWTELAKMTYPRSCHSLCIFGDLLIYAIFGQISSDTVANSIERYEVVNDAWTPLSLTVPKTVRNMKHMGSYALNKDELIIFGGADASSNQFYADSYIFNPALGEFKKTDKMKSATIFRNQPTCYKERIYAFGVDNYIHVFDTQNRKWSYIYDKLSQQGHIPLFLH
eukprot:TRINITY_DN430_c0_g1_i1.p2 TRINITY_DN430_c0_g1~~TRINITY_DN430_c0_g1_i1.p2  ORF type:complete len:562 (+),score=43.91 TRINITY_DN430_c0_g1_i1:90-1688(+)